MGPHYKDILMRVDADLEEVYDERLIESALSGNHVRFFQPAPGGTEDTQNYQDQPLSGNQDYYVVAIGFESLLPLITAGAVIDPVKIINTLQNAVVRLTIDGGRELIFEEPIQEFFDFEMVDYVPNGTSETVVLGSQGAFRIQNPFIIPSDTAFELWMEFGALVSDFPSAANWATDGQALGQDFGMRAILQYSIVR